MYNHWKEDLKDSVKAMESIKHTVLPHLISGEIHTIEQSQNEILIKIDTHSGIDYIRENEMGLQGIAARVQWGRAWNTFTIRSERHTGSKTELEKRIEAIRNGYFYPAFTMQAYFDNKTDLNCLSAAVIKATHLYKLYLKYPNLFGSNKSDNNFYFLPWQSVPKIIKKWPK